MIPVFNGLILDVIVIVSLLTIISIGAFKGILHTFIDSMLLALAIFLSFAPFMGVIRAPIVQSLSSLIDVGAVSPELKLGTYMVYPFLASLILTILFYAVFKLIKLVIVKLIERKKVSKLPDVISRISAATLSLLVNGIAFIALLTMFSTSFMGGNKTIENSSVAKHVEKVDESILEVVFGDKIEEKMIIKAINTDLFMKVSEEDISDFEVISKSIEEENLIPKDLSNPGKIMENLYKLLSYMEVRGLDASGIERDGYELDIEQTREIANKSISAFSSLRENGNLLEAENTLAVKNLLLKFKLEDTAVLLEETFIIK